MAGIPGRLVEALAGRYTISKEIGAGGMATVYRAQDLRHHRSVAIKVLRPDLAESLGPERFLREIEIAAALTHPHILPLHDSGDAGGFLYYVMPLIEGESLRDRLAREGALPIPEAMRILRDIADALGEAHRRGVVHRDMKPANVLLAGGHALVADFGVAKAVSDATGAQNLTTMGVALGTPQYMAPEQAAADPATDHRADLFAAGVIAYEMLTGSSPFAARTTPAIFAALMTKVPDAPHQVRVVVPEPLSELVMWCLEKSPDARPQSAGELLGRLDSILTPSLGVTPAAGVTSASLRGRRTVLLVAGAAVVVLTAGSIVAWRAREQRQLEEWARSEAVPEVLRLVGENRLREAAELAAEAETVLGPDPVLEPMWPAMSTPLRAESDPPGAVVSYRPYESTEEAWRILGTTPHVSERFPAGAFRFRVELAGFEAVEQARSFIPARQLLEFRNVGFDYLEDPSYSIDVRLRPVGAERSDMVAVTGGTYGLMPIWGFGVIDPIEIPEFLLDRTEVTNAAYRDFVAAGAYSDAAFWGPGFLRDGETLTFEAAMAELRDATGRPGPATWVLGAPPQGRDDYPVGGVSWFEADAFCRWSGKSLPTLFHWARAALPSSDVWAVPFNPYLAAASNLAGSGPEPVASRDAIGVSGAHDLAGNLREWVSTATGPSRHLAGGAWSDPAYALHDQTIASPWVRSEIDGFRCASYTGGAPSDRLTRSIDFPRLDLFRRVELPDAVFEAMRRPYEYDPMQPLVASVDSTRLVDGATIEWVSVDTPYGERLPLRIQLPLEGEPPFQAVVFFPGGHVMRSPRIGPPALDFLPRSGRVVVEPVYEGTFQRNDGRTLQRFATPAGRAEIVSHWIQDLGRTIDYLESRPDTDGGRVAFVGLSFGAAAAPSLVPFVPRFRALVLFSGGLPRAGDQAALDRVMGLAGRVDRPVLLLGGREDFGNHVVQLEGLLRAFGARDGDKRLRIFDDAGHWPLPMNEVIRETVDFLDRHLGPVGGSP